MDDKLKQEITQNATEYAQKIIQKLEAPKVKEAIQVIIPKVKELNDDLEAFGKWFRQYLLNDYKGSDAEKDAVLQVVKSLGIISEGLLRNSEVEKMFLVSDIEHGRFKPDECQQEFVESFARIFMHQASLFDSDYICVPKEKSLRDNGCILINLDYGKRMLVAPVLAGESHEWHIGWQKVYIKSSDNYEVFDNLLVVTRENGSMGCAKVDNSLKYVNKNLELKKFGDSFCLVGVEKDGAITSVDFYGKESSVEDIPFIGVPYETYADSSMYLCSVLCEIDKIEELKQKLFEDPKWFLELPIRLFEKQYKVGLKKCLAIVRSGLKAKAEKCTTDDEREEVQDDVLKVMSSCKKAKAQARKDVKERREAARKQKAANRKMDKSIDRIR